MDDTYNIYIYIFNSYFFKGKVTYFSRGCGVVVDFIVISDTM